MEYSCDIRSGNKLTEMSSFNCYLNKALVTNGPGAPTAANKRADKLRSDSKAGLQPCSI